MLAGGAAQAVLSINEARRVCMVSLTMRTDMQQLQAFLHGAYARGHPRDGDVVAFDEALGNLVANKTTAVALAAIKTALSEGSWFMKVLSDHAGDADFDSAMQLCVRISGDLKWVTCEEGPVPVAGDWEALPVIGFHDNPDDNPLIHEIDWCTFVRDKVDHYVRFVESRLGQLPPTCQDEMDKLKRMIEQCPASQKLLRWELNWDAGNDERRGPPKTMTWYYHTSYLASRGALLAALFDVMKQLDECDRRCKEAFPNTFEEERAENYQQCKIVYEEWQALAANKLRESVGMAQLRAREQGGRGRGVLGNKADMGELLRALDKLACA